MANWYNLGDTGNVEDRRSMSPAAVGGGLGLVGIVAVFLFNFLAGGNVTDALN